MLHMYLLNMCEPHDKFDKFLQGVNIACYAAEPCIRPTLSAEKM